MGDAERDARGGDRAPWHAENRLEAVVSLVSALLLAAVLGYLVWYGLRPADPPAFSAEVVEVTGDDGAHHLRFAVRNEGGDSVQNLTIRVEIGDPDDPLAEAETSLAWLPGGSRREAGVVLPVDPRAHDPRFVFVGYELP